MTEKDKETLASECREWVQDFNNVIERGRRLTLKMIQWANKVEADNE